jgi:hypothetical protein
VLTSYDRSPHISDTLRDLAATEDALGLREQAARHRQLLSSLFAQSPAATQLVASTGATAQREGAATPPTAPMQSTQPSEEHPAE